MTRVATCWCGQAQAVCEGEPARVSVCHCLNCQQRSGSLFAAQARWPREQVTIEGPSTAWRRTGDEGTVGEFHFCPVCGTTVWYVAPVDGDTIAVATGAFRDPDFAKPQYSVYDSRRHRWLQIPEGIEIY